MIKIIKHGTKQKLTCEECGCLFSFEETDFKPQKDPIKKQLIVHNVVMNLYFLI